MSTAMAIESEHTMKTIAEALMVTFPPLETIAPAIG
jgi:hypothetical protein